MARNIATDLFGGTQDVATLLLENNMDYNCLRRFRSNNPKDKRSYMTQNYYDQKEDKVKQKVVVTNAPSTLRYDEWKRIDQAVVTAGRPKLRIVSDLEAAGLGVTIPDGMGTIVIQHQLSGFAGNAIISMDGLRESDRDRILHDIGQIPLPIIHEDFSFSLREIMVSRRGGTPLDTAMAREAARNVADTADKWHAGIIDSYTYAGSTVYGIRNFPDRLTKVLTLPTAAGWTPETTANEVAEMIQQATDVFKGGPFGAYFSTGWSIFFNRDYSPVAPGYGTLMGRLRQTEEVAWWRKLEFLTGFEILLVQLDPMNIETLNGMPLTTLQWDSHGGMQLNFKVMTIRVPRIRSDANSKSGIIHGVAA
jgi:hypothetical protein